MDSASLKALAGTTAAERVKSGMKLGIGTGSTAEAFIKALGARIRKENLNIVGVPTSERTAKACKAESIPLTTLDETPKLDLTIDGADEIGPGLSLIKGGGGALLREKIVAAASDAMIVIADESKCLKTLGAFPLPIEINPFGFAATKTMIAEILKKLEYSQSTDLTLRKNDTMPFVTDGGHWIIDAHLKKITDPEKLGIELNQIPGVVEHGLFNGLATEAIIAAEDDIRILNKTYA
jgi:ribose 5-phosphate isomerase A